MGVGKDNGGQDQDHGLRAAAATAGANGGGVAVASVGVDEEGGAFQQGGGGRNGSGESEMGFEVSFAWWSWLLCCGPNPCVSQAAENRAV